MPGQPIDIVVNTKVRRVTDETLVIALTTRMSEAVQIGAVSSSGMGINRKDYTSDGTPRWHDRDITTAILRWKRPAVNAAEAVDLTASLASVPDDCNGWLVLSNA